MSGSTTSQVKALRTPNGLGANARQDITVALNGLLADSLTLYLKTKNFHWHLSGRHFRDYHLLFDEQAAEVFATVDPLAERVRKLGGITLHSIGEVLKLRSLADNDAEFVTPAAMLAELTEDNGKFAAKLRAAHKICDEHEDVATASLLEPWIDEAERRVWFLFETSRDD